MTKLLIVALASATALASYSPAQAIPMAKAPDFQTSSMVPVRFDGGMRHWHGGGWHGPHGWHGGHGLRGRFRGYGGYDGWYDDDDGGAFIGGLAAATMLGLVLNSVSRPAYRGNSHVSYCYSRYRSYRASDNTFQPLHGPRQQCR